MVELKRKVTLKTKSTVSEDDAAEKVHLKKKVTIKEEHAEEELPTGRNDGGNGSDPTPMPEHPKGRKWILWLIVIVVLAIIGYLWYSYSGSSEQGDGNLDNSTKVENTNSTKSQSSDSAATVDSSKIKGTNSEEETATKPEFSSHNGNDVEEMQKAPVAQTGKRAVKHSSDIIVSSKSEIPTNGSAGSVEETANEVIKGIYGNGDVRKDKLGSRYQEVQNRVNEMYRQGLVR